MIKIHQIDLDDPALYSIVNEQRIECAAYTEEDRLLLVHARQNALDSQLFPYHDDDEKRSQRLKKHREREQQEWDKIVAASTARARVLLSPLTGETHALESAHLVPDPLRFEQFVAKWGISNEHLCEWNFNVSHSSYLEGGPVNPVHCDCGAQAIFIRHPDGRVEFQSA